MRPLGWIAGGLLVSSLCLWAFGDLSWWQTCVAGCIGGFGADLIMTLWDRD